MKANRQKKIILHVLLMGFLSYSFYLYISLPVKKNPTNPVADAGKLVWQKYNCNACHQVYGLGGYLGPDLTNVYSRRGTAYIQAFLTTGINAMPVFHLSAEEKNALLTFMKEMDASGKADPKTYTTNYDGTIEQ